MLAFKYIQMAENVKTKCNEIPYDNPRAALVKPTAANGPFLYGFCTFLRD